MGNQHGGLGQGGGAGGGDAGGEKDPKVCMR